MSWMAIRTKTEARALNAVRAKILGWPEEVMRDVYRPIVLNIGQAGRRNMRETIRTSVTPTGIDRARRGRGEPGRISSGKMIKSLRVEVRDRAKGFTMNVGWTRGTPGYAIFQELGTAKIHGMDAVNIAREYMLSQLRAAARGKYTGDANFELEGPDD